MRRRVRVALAALAVLVGFPAAGRADTPADLTDAVRLWLGRPSLDAGAMKTIPEGDHWRISIPVSGLVQPGVVADPASGALTAEARRLPDGRWSIETKSVPSSLEIARSLDNGTTRRLNLQCGSQSASATVDPALKLRSRFSAQAHDVTQTLSYGSAIYTASVGDLRDRTAWQVVADAGTQLNESQHIDNFAMRFLAGPSAVQATVAHMDETLESHLVDVAKVTRGYWLPYVVTAVLSDSLAGDIPSIAGTHARSGIDQMASAAKMSREFDALGPTDITVAMAGVLLETSKVTATARTAGGFLSWGDPGGVADARLGIAIDGINVAPPSTGGRLPAMLPRSVAITFHAFGLPARETADLMRRLIATNGKPGRDVLRDIPVLLDKGPLVIELDTFSLKAGPARLNAHATLKVIRPRLIEGTAQITVSGLNAFIARAKADPKLAGLVPALIYGRGLGDRMDSGEVRWDMTLAAGHVVVNGVDVWPPGKPLSTPRR